MFVLVWCFGISTIVGYLMPNPPYKNISNIYVYDLQTFLNEPEFFFLHAVKWFHVLPYKSQFSISHFFTYSLYDLTH